MWSLVHYLDQEDISLMVTFIPTLMFMTIKSTTHNIIKLTYRWWFILFPNRRRHFLNWFMLEILNLRGSFAFHGSPSLDTHISFWWTTYTQPSDTDQIMEQKNHALFVIFFHDRANNLFHSINKFGLVMFLSLSSLFF